MLILSASRWAVLYLCPRKTMANGDIHQHVGVVSDLPSYFVHRVEGSTQHSETHGPHHATAPIKSWKWHISADLRVQHMAPFRRVLVLQAFWKHKLKQQETHMQESNHETCNSFSIMFIIKKD